ncbi:MAG: toll/interleukin-1 receptor domain-containing protein [Caulobacteraceae bacterium]
MATAAETATTRYSAFLSYSHADAPFVRRLHRRLESYRLPTRLRRGRPGKLDRVFMDRAELIAAPSLTQSVRDAIALSGHMIVVCSPASAASDWVGPRDRAVQARARRRQPARSALSRRRQHRLPSRAASGRRAGRRRGTADRRRLPQGRRRLSPRAAEAHRAAARG